MLTVRDQEIATLRAALLRMTEEPKPEEPPEGPPELDVVTFDSPDEVDDA